MHFASRARRCYDQIGPRAAVMVEVASVKKKLLRVVPGSITVVKQDAQMAYLPDGWAFLPPADDEDQTPIVATGKFVVTLESIDPFHLVADLF